MEVLNAIREKKSEMKEQQTSENDAKKQFREAWMRDTPGVIVAMRYLPNSGYDGLYIWKQNDVMQIKIIPLEKSWIQSNDEDDEMADKIMGLSRTHEKHFYPVDKQSLMDTGWFPMDAKVVRGLKYVKAYETSIGPKYEEISDGDKVNKIAKNHGKTMRDLTFTQHEEVKNRKKKTCSQMDYSIRHNGRNSMFRRRHSGEI